MSDAVKQEVKHYKSMMELVNEVEETFDKLAGSQCGHFTAAVDKFDGEHINTCKHSAHPYAKGMLAECLVNLCPLCK